MTSRNRAQRIVLLATGLMAALVMVELGLRLYSWLAFPKMMMLDDALGWKPAGDTAKYFRDELGESVLVKRNHQGLRGPLHHTPKAPGVRRILVVGDSFVEGVQVGEDDVLTARLQAVLPQAEVLNAGVGGYSTVQEYLYLREQGLALQPDQVVLVFYENDLDENLMPYYAGFGPRPHAAVAAGTVQIVRDPDPEPFLKFLLPAPFRLHLNRYSYLYYFLNRRLYQPWRAAEMRQWEQADANAVDLESRYQALFFVLGEVKRLLDQHGVELLVVLAPSRSQLKAGRAPNIERILPFCAEAGLDCLSLFDRLRREAQAGEKLHYAVDVHWTKAGHRVVADEVARHLAQINAKPPPP